MSALTTDRGTSPGATGLDAPGATAAPARRRHGWVPAGLLGLVMLAGAYGLGSYPLLEPDEGRNAESAREMAAAGSWLIPRYNSVPYLDKPLLWFDAVAVAMKVAGPRELAARLPSWVFTLATVLTVVFFARRHLGPEQGWVAGLATAASPLTLAYARIAIFDATLTFFIVAAICCCFEALARRPGEATTGARDDGPRWAFAAWIAMALAVLTKGPVGLALPLMVIVPFALWRRRLAALKSWPGPALFLALTAAYVTYMALEIPGYLRYVLVTESLSRLTTTELGRPSPWWYHLPFLLGGALPWSAAAAAAWWRRPQGREPDRSVVVLALFWLVVPLVLFSLSQPKRPHYVLPLMPAIALLLAARWPDPQARVRACRSGAVTLGVIGLTLGAAGLAPLDRHLPPELVPGGQFAVVALAAVCLAAAGLGFSRRRPFIALAGLVLPGLAMPVLTLPLMRPLAELRSSRDLATAITESCPQAAVVSVEDLPSSLPFYLRRPVIHASDRGKGSPSIYIERHWESLRAEYPVLRPAGWWRQALEQPGSWAFVVESRDDVARWWLEQAGTSVVYEDERHTVLTRCSGAEGPPP